MNGVPEPVLRLAEDSDAHQPLGPGEERIVTAPYIVYLGPHALPQWTVVQRLRLSPATVEPAVSGVRALLRARGRATFTEHGVVLNGGSTLPEARGRGAYRALVHARWEEAVRRGTPALVTQAGHMSRPILSRLGFREVCEIRVLLDRFGP